MQTIATAASPLTTRDSSQLRKQIVSVGKQPKAHQSSGGGGARRKKDMVSELFDSLTPAAEYFDPGTRRRRQQTRTYEEEQFEKVRG